MKYQFNSKAYYEMEKIRCEIQDKLDKNKSDKNLKEIYAEQLKIVNRCINSLY